MSLYELKQADVSDLLELVSSASLTITANNAKRVAQLQLVLAGASPSVEIEVLKERCQVLEKQNAECLRVRDNALLEAGVAKRRGDALELCSRGECDPATCESARHTL